MICPDSTYKSGNVVQTTGATSDSEREERVDLTLAQLIKDVLERLIGPEEGDHPVQKQNWDWNDDRTRTVYILRSAFKRGVIGELQKLLAGEYEDFRIVLFLQDTWDSEAWGGLLLEKHTLAVQRNVPQTYVLAI